jgi:hypothetical protein
MDTKGYGGNLQRLFFVFLGVLLIYEFKGKLMPNNLHAHG